MTINLDLSTSLDYETPRLVDHARWCVWVGPGWGMALGTIYGSSGIVLLLCFLATMSQGLHCHTFCPDVLG